MAGLVIDWKKSAGNKYKIYPSGTYLVSITGWEQVEAATGTPQIRWFANIIDPKEHEGERIVDHTPLTDLSFWRLANLVQAAGINVVDAPKMIVGSKDFNKLLDTVVGRKVYWAVKYDERYNNNKVEDYQPVADQEVITPEYATGDDSPFPTS